MDERRLRNRFQFTAADLAANRRGQFSEAQKKRLEQAARAERASARSSAAILFVVAAAGLAIGLTVGSIAPNLPGRLLMYFFMGFLWPAVWAGKGVQIIRAANVLQQPQLRSVSGPIQLLRHGDTDYGLQVAGIEFDLDGNPAGALLDGDAYTVHYVAATEEILSIERQPHPVN